MKITLYLLHWLCSIVLIVSAIRHDVFKLIKRKSATKERVEILIFIVALVMMMGMLWSLLRYVHADWPTTLDFVMVLIPVLPISVYNMISSIHHPGGFLNVNFWNFGIIFTLPIWYLILLPFIPLHHWFFYSISSLHLIYYILINIICLDSMNIIRIK